MERWKAEGGDRHESEESEEIDDDFQEGEEDNWDFGTVRHTMRRGGRGTVAMRMPASELTAASAAVNSGQPLNGNYASPGMTKELPNIPSGAHLNVRNEARFGTSGSSGSAGSGSGSGGGTVRLGAPQNRPAILPTTAEIHSQQEYAAAEAYNKAIGGVAHLLSSGGNGAMSTTAAGPASGVKGRDFAAHPPQANRNAAQIDDDYDGQDTYGYSAGRAGDGNHYDHRLEEERRRMEELELHGHSKGLSSGSDGRVEQPMEHAARPHGRLTALDTVFLPVLEQVRIIPALTLT